MKGIKISQSWTYARQSIYVKFRLLVVSHFPKIDMCCEFVWSSHLCPYKHTRIRTHSYSYGAHTHTPQRMFYSTTTKKKTTPRKRTHQLCCCGSAWFPLVKYWSNSNGMWCTKFMNKHCFLFFFFFFKTADSGASFVHWELATKGNELFAMRWLESDTKCRCRHRHRHRFISFTRFLMNVSILVLIFWSAVCVG